MSEEMEKVEVVEDTVAHAGEIPPKHDWKGLLLVGLVVVVAVGLCSLFYPLLKDMIQSSNGDNTDVVSYKTYLKKVKGSEEDVVMYVDAGFEANEYYMTLHNTSAYVFSGEVLIYDEDDKKLDSLSYTYARPRMQTGSYVSYEKEPTSYLVDTYSFYELDYPDVDFDYELVYDYDEETEWYNIELGSHYRIEAVYTLAKRLYVLDALANVTEDLYLLYDSSVTYYEDDYGVFCDPTSAKQAIFVSLEEKTVTIYDIVDGSLEIRECITME